MEENLKQRLVGAAVLAALAVIFLPALFDKDERVEIDTASQIPPAPVIEPVTIPKPTKPENVNIPPAQELFQPVVVEPESVKADNKADNKPSDKTLTKADKEKVKPVPKVTKPREKKATTQPRLNSKGVPVGWVVQAASFSASESADKFAKKLQKAGYKAYSQPVKTAKGEFFRVLIGPYIDEKKAIKAKRTIDKTYDLSSRVLRFNPVSGD